MKIFQSSIAALLLLAITALPSLASPNNTSGPWGIDAGGFRNLSTALTSPSTVGKIVVISKPMAINNKTTDRAINVMAGGSIIVGGVNVFTTNGPFAAGQYQAFAGSGTVKFPAGSTVRPEWAGITGVADDVGINKVINYLPGGSGTVLAPGAYHISGTINMIQQHTTLDMTGGSVTSSTSMTSYFNIQNYFNTLKGVSIGKTGGTVTQAIYITGRNQNIIDVNSMDAKFPIFMTCENMWDSHITRLRVDGDVSGRSGVIIAAAQSVNNTVTDCSLQYQGKGIYFYSNGAGNNCEGWLITGTTMMMLNTAIRGDYITSLQVSNCMLDLNSIFGIVLTNGHTALISNNWFGTVVGATITHVVAGNNFPYLVVTGNKFTGVGKTLSRAISSTSPFAIVSGNAMENIAGGVVMWSNSTVFGNTYDSNSSPMSQVQGTLLVEGGLNVNAGDLTVGAGNFSVAGTIGFNAMLAGSATSTPGGYALPALAKEFITVTVNGVARKIATYEP
jgi:hypothetical protein